MDGYSLTRGLREILSETSTGTWLDNRENYDLLYDAAVATADRTGIFTSTQVITTVGDQANYSLNADFMRLYLKDSWNRLFIKLYDGSSYYWLFWRSYDEIVLNNQTTSVRIPSAFSIKYITTPVSRITGTASADGAATNGECTLTDTSSGTKFSTVVVGDEVNNTTDGGHGIVIVKTSDTALVTCMFDGTNNDYTSADAYILSPQGRFELVFDPPPSTSAYTATVYYIQRPTPVYSLYRTYNFPIDFKDALINYAAWRYKYRDTQPNMGDAFYKYWDNFLRRYGRTLNTALNRKGFTVNLIKT